LEQFITLTFLWRILIISSKHKEIPHAKFFVDFEFAGHIEVEAKNKKDAKEMVEDMSLDELAEHIQNFNIGKHYEGG